MIQDLFYFFENIIYPIHIGIETSHYYQSIKNGIPVENELNCKKHGVLWTRLPPYRNDIKLIEVNSTIWAYPSPDFQYVVAVYDGFTTKKYLAPSNAVVYNSDGTVHNIISYSSDKKNTMFSGVGWAKTPDGELVMYLKILGINGINCVEEKRYFYPKIGFLGDVFSRNKI